MAEEEEEYQRRRKLGQRLRTIEKRDRILKKDKSADRAVMEEVFDSRTLVTIYEMMNRGVIRSLHGVVKAGKEARIYLGVNSEGKEFAVKIYLTSASDFKKMLPYIEGDPRFKNTKKDTRSIIYLWARKEYRNLQVAFQANVRVPQPFYVKNNVLVMEFIGEKGVPAPRLKDKAPEDPEKMYLDLIGQLVLLCREAKIVHGDLSEYNIMNRGEEAILFDLSQAVSIEHPRSQELLIRDIRQINWYFDRLGVDVMTEEELVKRLRNDG